VVSLSRVKGACATKKRRNKVLKAAKGYWGAKSRCFKMAKQAVMKSGNYAYIGRRHRKRDFRRLWITRISAACRLNGTNYSQFMHLLKLNGIIANRKMLSEIAAYDSEIFANLTASLKPVRQSWEIKI
jgi:large subunit ribosomal protein L20